MKQIPLTLGQVALVDDADFIKVSQFKWFACWDAKRQRYIAKGYFKIDGKWKQQAMHRWLLNAPTNRQVDHRDRDSLNNQRSNLRLATHGQNQQNQKAQKNNKLGLKGVFYATRDKAYKASISANKIHYHLGYFKTAQEASKAYNAKARELHGDFAVLNPE